MPGIRIREFLPQCRSIYSIFRKCSLQSMQVPNIPPLKLLTYQANQSIRAPSFLA
ncbi:hypothetical protein BVIET440_200082 [Burkholderia vietnamiensis]